MMGRQTSDQSQLFYLFNHRPAAETADASGTCRSRGQGWDATGRGARGRWLLAKGATGVSAGVLFCGRPKNEACAFCPPDVYSVESLIFQGGVHAKHLALLLH
jgi:hypothetical protein